MLRLIQAFAPRFAAGVRSCSARFATQESHCRLDPQSSHQWCKVETVLISANRQQQSPSRTSAIRVGWTPGQARSDGYVQRYGNLQIVIADLIRNPAIRGATWKR
jgi:hypothetical protein